VEHPVWKIDLSNLILIFPKDGLFCFISWKWVARFSKYHYTEKYWNKNLKEMTSIGHHKKNKAKVTCQPFLGMVQITEDSL